MVGSGPRLRFAPSPSGALHVGGARTALVNWLEARRLQGVLVLRIEDTDAERSSRAAERGILEDLEWLGIVWDEGPDRGGPRGPYRQSERLERYREAVEALLEAGRAYPCFCDPETLARLRRRARADGETFRYPGTCRDLDESERRRRGAENPQPVARFRVPRRDVHFDDGLRGRTGLEAGQIGDFVLLRADRTPTYNLVCVVDDHDMAIDHVVRGEDHLPNTPRQLLLYEALGFEPPRFTHLPLVLAEDRSRLSKRHGATAIAELRQMGILPEALRNYLALLGWHPPGAEVLDTRELVAAFDVAALSPTAAVFDIAKLEWLNARHMERLAPERLLEAAAPLLESAGQEVPAAGPQRAWWQQAVDLMRAGRRRLDELPSEMGAALWPDLEAVAADPRRRAELAAEPAATVLDGFAAASRADQLGDEASFRAVASRLRRTTGAGGADLYHPLRVALTGRDVGPELARLVPLIEAGAGCGVEPRVQPVWERIATALGPRPDDADG